MPAVAVATDEPQAGKEVVDVVVTETDEGAEEVESPIGALEVTAEETDEELTDDDVWTAAELESGDDAELLDTRPEIAPVAVDTSEELVDAVRDGTERLLDTEEALRPVEVEGAETKIDNEVELELNVVPEMLLVEVEAAIEGLVEEVEPPTATLLVGELREVEVVATMLLEADADTEEGPREDEMTEVEDDVLAVRAIPATKPELPAIGV